MLLYVMFHSLVMRRKVKGHFGIKDAIKDTSTFDVQIQNSSEYNFYDEYFVI